MSSVQFERLYGEAISVLRRDHPVTAVYAERGKRFCIIDGQPLDDEKVLTLAYGPEVPITIRETLPTDLLGEDPR